MHVQALMMSGVPAAGSSFNPQTQGTLVNWYDASTLGLANNAAVNPFTDSKTGNPNPLTPPSASPPIYATSQQNGLGTTNWTSGGALSGGSSASTYPYTIAAVVKMPSLGSGQCVLGPLENNGGLEFAITGTGALNFSAADIADIGSSTSTISTGSYYLVIGTISSTTYAFYINGSAAGSGSHSVSLTGSRTFQMGLKKTSEDGFTGYIAEVQIYSSVLSGTDLSGLHTYIVNKWATP